MPNGSTPRDSLNFRNREGDRSPLGSISNPPIRPPHTPSSPSPSPSRFHPHGPALNHAHRPSPHSKPTRNHSLTHLSPLQPKMSSSPLHKESSLSANERTRDNSRAACDDTPGWSFSRADGAAEQPLTPVTNSPPQRMNGSPFGSGTNTTRPHSSSSEASQHPKAAARMDSLGKRRRELEAESGDGPKSKRPTPDPVNPGPMHAPPMSRESSHGQNSALRDLLGGDFDMDMQEMQREHAEAAERLEQERARRQQQIDEDELAAQRLHAELNGTMEPEAPVRPAPFRGPSTQSKLGTDGRFRRPSPSPPSTMLAPAPTASQSLYNSSRSGPSNPPTYRKTSDYVSIDSDDDDIQIVDVKPVSQSHGQTSRTLPWPSSNGYSRGSLNLTEAVDLTRTARHGMSNGHSGLQNSRNNSTYGYNPNGSSGLMGTPRLPGIGSMGQYHGAPGSSVFGSTMNQLGDVGRRMPGAYELDDDESLPMSILNRSIVGYPSNPGGFANGIANRSFAPGGMSSFGNLDSSYNAIIRDPFPASIRTRMPWGPADDDTAVRGPFDLDDLDPYSYNSPWNEADNSEALKDLLSNIRPDEDVNLGSDDRDGTPEGMADTANLYKYQQRGLAWLSKMEEGSNKGSILADDMGLGKTIQAIALMVSRRSTDEARKTNLIVAPVALIRQWESEIESKVRPSHRLSTFIYHGSNAAMKKMTFKELSKFDVVITTFGSLQSDHKKLLWVQKLTKENENFRPKPSDKPVLVGAECRWYRVILDEAQNIKNRHAKTSLAAYQLMSTYRLCMTGTPMMNNITELFSLIHFLRIKPYCVWEKFNIDFARPLKSQNPFGTQRVMQRVQALCKAIMLRRNKKSTFEGKPLITLPERFLEVDHAEFDEDQAAFYKALETQSQLQFNKFLKAGTVGRNYSNVLTLLLRLRQAACHPHLIKDFAISINADPADLFKVAKDLPPVVVARLIESGITDCPVCMDAAPNYTIFHPCGHSTCPECYCRLLDSASTQAAANDGNSKTVTCHSCRATIDSKEVTDFDSFKLVHMPDLAEAQGIAGAKPDDEEDDSDDESSSDDDDTEDEDDDGSDLGDFVVDDDDEVALGKVKEEASDEDDGEDLDVVRPARSTKSQKKKAQASKKVKTEIKDEDHDDDFVPEEPGYSHGANPFERANGKKIKKSKKKKSKGKGKEKEKKGRKTMAELKKEAMRSKPARRAYMRRLAKDYVPSAKTAKCMELLETIRDAEEGEKTIVFSQFTSLLDLIEIPINQKGWRYTRFDGSMNATDRNDAVQLFTKDPRYKVMLVSLKAGNAGLNLTAASQVIILDPFWNPYIEEQAIDRAHRIGQKRRVQIHRVLVTDTVEDRICALQEKKRALIEGALDEGAGKAVGRLGTQELAYLFGVRT